MLPRSAREIDSEDEVGALIRQLEESTQLKRHGRCTKFINKINDGEQELTSWKFNEWDYGREDKIQLPIKARGLFTSEGRICVRGYDKFFNVNEVPQTKLKNLEKDTRGPYELTVKENGCIIFISGLANGELVVCSKHSTGQRLDTTRNHAVQGQREVEKQLAQKNLTVESLARELYEHNLTAVAELCDDEFEEHVLPYSKDRSGLYLHGLNSNTIKFRTQPMSKVDEFAREWGFKLPEYVVKDSFELLVEFLTLAAETGTFQGKEVEGFVVRCILFGNNYFFKYKFEEPYLLYRQFREVTKSYAGDNLPIRAIISKTKNHKYITLKYLEFVERLFDQEPKLKQNFLSGFGIIRLRQLFLKEIGLNDTEGMSLMKYDDLDSQLKQLKLEPTSYKYVLIAISTIGCGKTTVFQTLTNIYPTWAHIQNDNIPNSSSKTKLVDACLEQLAKDDTPLVFCDRNNHQKRERKQLFDQFLSLKDNYLPSDVGLRFVAVNFVNEIDKQQLWDLTFERISKRGNNHQSIKFEENEKLAKLVMNGFIQRFQPLDPNQEPDSFFDLVINLQLSKDSSLESAKHILNSLQEFQGLIEKLPDIEIIESSFKKSLEYKPTFTKTFGKGQKKEKKGNTEGATAKKKDQNQTPKDKGLVFYGIRVERSPLLQTLDKILKDEAAWSALKQADRVQDEFHITLAHVNSAKNGQADEWAKLKHILGPTSPPPKDQNITYLKFYASVQLNRVIMDDSRLICIDATLNSIKNSQQEPVDVQCLNAHPHVTIGTSKPEIKPFESNLVLESLFSKYGGDISDGVYQVDDSNIRVMTMTEDSNLQQLPCFAHF